MFDANGEFCFQGNGLTTSERNWGKQRFFEYRDNYPHLHKMSDLSLLEDLIFQEAMHERLKHKISYLTKNQKVEKSNVIPSNLQNALKESIDLQIKLKEKLGLFEEKDKLDAFRDFEQVKEDFKEYRRQNSHLFKTTCPSCGFIFFLKRRTDKYEEIDSPWFKNKILCNPQLWEAYELKEISKDRIANILGVSTSYIDWLAEKIFKKENKEDSAADKPAK